MVQPDDFANGFALTIGTPFNAQTPANDAQAMADVLIDDNLCAYPPEQVTRLLPDAATRSAIRAELKRLAQRTNADSTVIIFYSGHGQITADGKFYLQPKDADPANLAKTGISGAELARSVKKIPARKIVVILDCCHAGAADLARTSLHTATASGPGIAAAPQDPRDTGAGRVVLASSKAGERSSSDFPTSMFTTAVRDALSGTGIKSDDGFVHLSDVIRYACAQISQLTDNLQNPIFISTGATDFRIARYSGSSTPVDPAQLAQEQLLPLGEGDPGGAAAVPGGVAPAVPGGVAAVVPSSP